MGRRDPAGRDPCSQRESSRCVLPRCRGAQFSKSNSPISNRARHRGVKSGRIISSSQYERIILLNEEDNDAAVKKISAMDTPPTSERGRYPRDHQRKVELRRRSVDDDDRDQRLTSALILASHNSGHFTKVVWKKAVGLIEYASGYGAHADGFRLKRQN